MTHESDKKLFTTGQVAKACNITATTLIRMEKDGLISPCKINKETGYRYYDDYNVAEILQLQMLRNLGLSTQDAIDYYHDKEDPDKILSQTKPLLKTLTYFSEELALRANDTVSYFFDFFEVPALTCYTHTDFCKLGSDSFAFGYRVFCEAISRGYTLCKDEPLMVLRADEGRPTEYGQIKVKCCIPIMDKNMSDQPEIETIPGGNLFTIAYRGMHEDAAIAHHLLFQEIKKRNLRPVGALRSFADIAPHTNPGIPLKEYIIRYGMMVEEQEDA